MAISQEYYSLFAVLSSRGHEIPDEKILANYLELQKWRKRYQEDPEIADDPYKRYSHGL